MLIKTDSRKIKQGDIFLALRGNNDGHQYIEDAIKNGASKIIAEEGNYNFPTEIVKDTREYLANYLKQNHYNEIKHIKLIGITGTNGKTTTAYLIYQALNKLNIKTAYIGTIGFYINNGQGWQFLALLLHTLQCSKTPMSVKNIVYVFILPYKKWKGYAIFSYT